MSNQTIASRELIIQTDYSTAHITNTVWRQFVFFIFVPPFAIGIDRAFIGVYRKSVNATHTIRMKVSMTAWNVRQTRNFIWFLIYFIIIFRVYIFIYH